MKAFQVRSLDRDAQTDAARLSIIDTAIDGAIMAAEREFNALEARVKNAQDLASFAMGNDSTDYLDREEKDTRRISAYENQMVNGRLRLETIEDQIEKLKAVRQFYDATFSK